MMPRPCDGERVGGCLPRKNGRNCRTTATGSGPRRTGTSLVNGNSIFLPASATKDELDHYTRYWSADVSSNWAAKSIDLDPALVTITSSPAKQFGQSVRAVLDGEKHEVVLPAGCDNYADYYRLLCLGRNGAEG